MNRRPYEVALPSAELAKLASSTIRMLSAEAIEKAKSGHPGAPMGMADLAFVLWSRYLRFNPQDPTWLDRDRVILSNGHASMMLYSMLHLCGYDLSMDEIKQFRQWGSRTAGHPEYGMLPGVEVTTGPLGQGFTNAVGLSVARANLAARFNTNGRCPVQGRTFVFLGDGCVMEGIVQEAASLAGHLGLGNLTAIYDDNGISIDGSTHLALSDDTRKRFEALGWAVLACDGHDHAQIAAAYDQALAITDRPCLIMARTTIGFGSPNKGGTCHVHGAPLGADELAKTRAQLGWTYPPFTVPDEVAAYFKTCVAARAADYDAWKKEQKVWRDSEDDLWAQWTTFTSRSVPADLKANLLAAAAPGNKATRKQSAAVIKKLVSATPWLFGGSADLTPSNGTEMPGAGIFGKLGDTPDQGPSGRYLHFGVREHAMAAMVNGMTLSQTHRAFCATFLVFADYMRPAIRLAAMMELPSIFLFSHDSFMVGEDGPTHQPIEHLASLRLIPGVTVLRPADGPETAMAWYHALTNLQGPTVITLTRQDLPVLERPADFNLDRILRGGYVLEDQNGASLVLVASGSEVAATLEAGRAIRATGRLVRVVSMPSLELFLKQDKAYRDSVIPPACTLVTVEAGITLPWRQLTAARTVHIGIDHFGASAPAEVLSEKFGFTAQALEATIRKAIR
jgi:transketolase